MIKKILISLLLLVTTFIATPFSAFAAGSPGQTILTPGTPKKSPYPKIIIYTVSWCPHCREAKEYLTSRNIPFINRDVELDPKAMDELVQKYKTYGVPVLVLGNDQEVLKGFTAEQFEKAAARISGPKSK